MKTKTQLEKELEKTDVLVATHAEEVVDAYFDSDAEEMIRGLSWSWQKLLSVERF